jgi:phosphoglycolate phosphatase-like HAD superfamily hydrolase
VIQNIIWDVDGTLFDTYPAIARAFKAALKDYGKDAQLDWIEKLAKVSLGHCSKTLVDEFQLNEEDIDKAFGKHYDQVKPEEQPPFPGVISICKYIHSIHGRNLIITHRRRDSTNELLASNRMTHFFSRILSSDDGYPKKPDPAAFEAILQLEKLNREETINVGDRDIDILAGQAAGIFSCLFGHNSEKVNADFAYNSFDELHRYIISRNQ